MQENKQALISATKILSSAKDSINSLELPNHIKIGVISSLDSNIRKLQHLSGQSVKTDAAPKFSHVTNFLGTEIKTHKKVKAEDLEPTKDEDDLFIERVNKLYEEFKTIVPEGILNSYTIPEDVIIVRGVAKLADVPEYETKEMNLKFIEEIAATITAKEQADKENAKIEEDLKKQAELTAKEQADKENAKPKKTTNK